MVQGNDGDTDESEEGNETEAIETEKNVETFARGRSTTSTSAKRNRKELSRRSSHRGMPRHRTADETSSKLTLWNRIQFSPLSLALGAIVAFGGLWLNSPSLKLSADHERWAKTLGDHLKDSELIVASELPFPSVHSLNSAEGLRLLGTQKLLIWRLHRNELDGKPDASSPEWKLTSPILARLSATDLTRKNRNLRELFGATNKSSFGMRVAFAFSSDIFYPQWTGD